VPVIASRLGGLPELLGPERCIPPNDPDALADRITELWEEPERRRAAGEALMRRARERHGEERFSRELLRLYERLMSSQPGVRTGSRCARAASRRRRS
jgi:glycosyltransferase involved in cell wall biosynthesis